jgi:hypothetical protein
MAVLFDADGDRWEATLDRHDRRRAVQTIVFHCVSNTQRPYRVIEVPDDALNGRSLESLSKDEMAQLFGRTHVMDYTHDRAASPRSHGYGGPPLG